MANSLVNVAPILYSAARDVPRELTGLIGAVDTDFADKGVAKGDVVKIGISPIATVGAFTPSQTFTVGADRTPTSKTLTLSQENVSSWNLTPEQERSLGNGGIADDILKQTVSQHLRAHINAMESYLWGVARVNASRSTGTPGTNPFATTINSLADARKILVDNGTAMDDVTAVMDTTAGTALRQVANLYKVSEAGDQALLRQGVLGNLYGIKLRESAAVTIATKGTGASYTSNTAGYAVGSTSITLITGTGTVLAGDTVTFAGDTNKYIVATGVAAPGTIVLQEPGLKVALAASAVAMTVGNTATQNLVLNRKAVVLVARPGLQPAGGGVDQLTVADPQTGLSFLLYRAVGDGIASWYMRTVFDAFSPNPYAMAQLLG